MLVTIFLVGLLVVLIGRAAYRFISLRYDDEKRQKYVKRDFWLVTYEKNIKEFRPDSKIMDKKCYT